MKYIITESQMDRAVLKFLNSQYGDLVPYKTNKHPNHIFFIKDGEVILEYNKINGYVYVSYEQIWSFLESFFELDYKEILHLSKKWVEEHYKLDVTSIFPAITEVSSSAEKQFKLKNPHR